MTKICNKDNLLFLGRIRVLPVLDSRHRVGTVPVHSRDQPDPVTRVQVPRPRQSGKHTSRVLSKV